MAPSEAHYYKYRRLLFSLAGVDIDVEGEERSALGIPYTEGAKIVYSPSSFITPKQIQEKVSGGSISKRSVLVIEGVDELYLENLHLDGTLIIKAVAGVSLFIRDLDVRNRGIEFVDLTTSEMAHPSVPEYLKMRGYKKIEGNDSFVIDIQEPGVYEVGADGVKQKISKIRSKSSKP